MNTHSSVLGIHQPGPGWLFRLGVGAKYLLVLVLGLVPIVAGAWQVTIPALGVTLTVLASSGISPRRALRVGWVLWAFLAVLVVFHLVTLRPDAAVVQPGNLLNAVLAARILTLTTSTPVLVDALMVGLRPLRLVRIDPNRVALTVALMLRSIPFLMGSLDEAGDAARARGLGRNPLRLLTPVMLGAVAYAERTGEALHARGLVERPR